MVKKVYLFGSRARDDFKPDSDLDLAIEVNRVAEDENAWITGFFEISNLQAELQRLLPNHKLHLEHLHPDRTPHVKAGVETSGILIYSQ